ncbi:MAG: hypothetical protein WC101_04750 [Candidatus Gracilibacteria bacterium]
MKKIRLTNLAIFIIFFAAALLEAVQKQNWALASVFLGLGLLSLWADLKKKN